MTRAFLHPTLPIVPLLLLAAVDLCGNRMPNGRSGLPMEQIDAVRDWINAGAADN